MTKKPFYRWNLRLLMAERQMFATTDLLAPLAARGISLSSVQVYRLVTKTPERLNLEVLAALCDILSVGPSELIETGVETQREKKVAGETASHRGGKKAPQKRPTRARIIAD